MNKDKMAVFVAGDKGSGENVMQIVFNAESEGGLSVQARMLADANGNQWSEPYELKMGAKEKSDLIKYFNSNMEYAIDSIFPLPEKTQYRKLYCIGVGSKKTEINYGFNDYDSLTIPENDDAGVIHNVGSNGDDLGGYFGGFVAVFKKGYSNSLTVAAPFGVLFGDEQLLGKSDAANHLNADGTKNEEYSPADGDLGFELAKMSGMYWYGLARQGETVNGLLDRFERDIQGVQPYDGFTTIPRGGLPRSRYDNTNIHTVIVSIGREDILAGMDIEELKESVVNLMLKLKLSWRQVAFMTVSSAGMDTDKRYVAYQYNSWLNKEAEKKGIHIIDYNNFADENLGTHYRMIRYKNSMRGAGLTASGAKLLAERILSGKIKMPMMKKFKLKSELGFHVNNASSWVNKVNLKLKNGSKVVDAVYEKAKGNEVVILNEFDFLTSPNIEITMFDAEVRSDLGYGEYGLNRIEIIEA